MTGTRTCSQTGVVALTAIALISATAPQALAFVEVARGELLFETEARVGYDSNIFSNANEIDDTVFSLTPAFVYLKPQGGMIVDARAGVAIERFDENDSEDTENKFARANITIPTVQGSPLKAAVNLTYFDGRQTDIYLNNRIDVRTYGADFRGSYAISPLTTIRGGVEYSINDPEALPDNSVTGFTGGFGYRIRPEAELYGEYRRRRLKSAFSAAFGRSVSLTEDAFRIGIDGQIGPVVRGNASVGYQTSDADNASEDYDQVIADVRLDWEPRALTSYFINITSDSAVTNNVDSVERIAVALGINQKIGRAVTARGEARWETYDFRTASSRSDDIWQGIVGLNYEPNRHLILGAEVLYASRESDLAFADYDRTATWIFGTFRY